MLLDRGRIFVAVFLFAHCSLSALDECSYKQT